MSTDLYVETKKTVDLRRVLPSASVILANILCLTSTPELTVDTLENGSRSPDNAEELPLDPESYFLVSIANEPETVALSPAGGRNIAVIIGAMRTALEFVLGAALAIALAREQGVFTDNR